MQRIRLVVLAALVIASIVVFVILRAGDAPKSPADAARAGSLWNVRMGPPPAETGPVTFIIAGAADDQFYVEPCSKQPSGGVLSLAALYKSATPESGSSVPVFLGDLTHAAGELGRSVAAYHYSEVLTESGVKIAAAGPTELAHGSEFCRSFLSSLKYPVLCANAADASGSPVLRGWTLLDSAQGAILVIATADPSVQDELTAGGSDLRILPAQDAVEDALRQGRAAAAKVERPLAASVLFHHGTVDQTAGLVRQVPGLTFAVAARGGDLPDADPLDAGGTPVFASPRGLRFAWVVATDGGSVRRWSLMRLGMMLLAQGSPIEPMLFESAVVTRDMAYPDIVSAKDDRRPEHPDGRYVGAQTCARCHAEQVGAHQESAHARRPARFDDVSLGRPQCIRCHMTGGLVRTGWRGKDDTSDLGAVSCEACHGPGAAHVESQDKPYGRDAIRRCRECHTPDRNASFDAEDLWKRWGHGARR